MDFAHRLVSLAYQSLGYFVVEGVSAGLREADLLAIKLDETGQVCERLHVEVHVSVNPSGILRAQAAYADSEKHPARSAGQYIKKKYDHEKVVQAVRSRLGQGDYKRVFVHGRLKERRQLRVFDRCRIEHWAIGELVSNAFGPRRAREADPVAELKRQVMIAELLSIKEP